MRAGTKTLTAEETQKGDIRNEFWGIIEKGGFGYQVFPREGDRSKDAKNEQRKLDGSEKVAIEKNQKLTGTVGDKISGGEGKRVRDCESL